MYNQCVDELVRAVPRHVETERAITIAASLRPTWRTAAGWLAIAAASIFTLVHALWNARRRSGIGAVAATLVAAGLLAFPGRALASEATDPPEHVMRPGSMSEWPVDDKDPLKTVPTPAQRDSEPLQFGYHLMDLADKAQEATKRGDHEAAAKFYEAMAKAVPDVSIAFGKMCESYEAAGQREKAITACEVALTKQGVRIDDYSRFARLVLSKPTRLEPQEIEDVDAVAEHLKSDSGARAYGFEVECNLAVRLGDPKRLEECAPALAAIAPDAPKTLFFQWSLALQKHDYAAARLWLDRARASSMPKEEVQRMDDALVGAMPIWRRTFHDWRIATTLVLLAVAGVGMFMTWRRSHAMA
jgi:hypothetical protein